MDASHELLQYVMPAIVAACAAALVGVIPYFLTKRETTKERCEAERTQVETARLMYDGLAQRVTQLEAENENLRRQHEMLRKENAYTSDLQAAKSELEMHVDELSGRINTLERTLKIVIDAFRQYIANPGIDGGDTMIELLRDIEGQTRL